VNNTTGNQCYAQITTSTTTHTDNISKDKPKEKKDKRVYLPTVLITETQKIAIDNMTIIQLKHKK